MPRIYSDYRDNHEYCPRCGVYIHIDFSHYSEFDGRPVWSADCACPRPDLNEFPSRRNNHMDKGFRNSIKFE